MGEDPIRLMEETLDFPRFFDTNSSPMVHQPLVTSRHVQPSKSTKSSDKDEDYVPSEMSLIDRHPIRPKRMLSDVSTEEYARTDSVLGSDNSKFNRSTKSQSPDLVLVKDSPELRKFLAKSNQTLKSCNVAISDKKPPRMVSEFENTFVKDNFTDANKTKEKSSLPKLGRRTTPLTKEKRQHAKEMRIEGACLRCRLSKTIVCFNTFVNCPSLIYLVQ